MIGSGSSAAALFDKQAPTCLETLAWIASSPFPLNRDGLKCLAQVLHAFSISGRLTAPTGSEHELYYALRLRRDYPRMMATHGKLVSIGTLLTMRAWSEARNDFASYCALRLVFAKIGLPLSFDALDAIGVSIEHIAQACRDDVTSPLYRRFFAEGDLSLLYRIFDPSLD